MIRFCAMAVAISACFLNSASIAQAADKPGCICGPDCACKPGVCPGGCPVQLSTADYAQFVAADAPVASGHYEQRCSNGKCTLVWVPASGAKSASIAVPAVSACTSCGTTGSAVSGGLFPNRPHIFPLFPNRPKLLGHFLGRTRGCSSCN